ncbi:helix-turn-helix domain-containing protein [Natrononativus amylolyticus]|uniref:helix-turn-helix domain-containing protein n=1 Tax=Natrononativus amylolyticus TaxID=2963434 RepID=UPI0020CF6758|nr:helix-turn-helix domain-containing protein [Natrononativus amylolyticus]
MSSGIRATVKVSTADECPIARFSRTTETTINQVSTSVSSADETDGTTEFLAETDHEVDGPVTGPVFSYGTTNVYRRSHDGEDRCPCASLGAFGCPVHRYVAADGDVTLVFHAADFEQLQDVMGEFQDRFSSVDVQSLLQPPLEGTPEERIFVNRGKLTDRQLEVLQTAYNRGYFERPKGANATEVAEELGITQSTFTEHLVAAQRKIFEDVLEADT